MYMRTLKSHLAAVLVFAGIVFIPWASCSGPTPTPAEWDEPYHGSITFGEALDVLAVSVETQLRETGWDAPSDQKCVGIHPRLPWGRDESVDDLLLDELVSRVSQGLSMEVLLVEVDEHAMTAESPCPEKSMLQSILLRSLELRSWPLEERTIVVGIEDWCTAGCWGGSGYEYFFIEDGDQWKLERRRSLPWIS